VFNFKYFSVKQSDSAMKVGTDSMLLGAFVDVKHNLKGLDIGSGTGVLSLMVAQKNSQIEIDAIEIDSLASKECSYNFEQSAWSDRLQCYNQDFIDFDSNKKYDLIFSNPPYYTTTKYNDDLRRTAARHEESLPIKLLLDNAQKHLSINGVVWLILPYSDFEKWNSIARDFGLFCSIKIKIKGKENKKPNRVIASFGTSEYPVKTKNFVLRNDDNSYTDEYISLTKEFHGVRLK